VVTGHALVPGGQCAGNAVPQHARVTGEEVHLVPGLQREQVVRVLQAQVFQHPGGLVPVAVRHQPRGLQVQALARSGRQHCGGIAGGPRHGDAGRLGAQQVQPGQQQVRHGELGIGLDGLLSQRGGVADEAAELVQRLLVGDEAGGGGTGQVVVESVFHRVL
jgi:hypothetical protein